MNTETLKVPPHDLDAERGVLGAVLLDAQAIHRAQERMTESDFYRTQHQIIFRAMCQLSASGEPVDSLSLASTLEAMGKIEDIGGRAALAELLQAVPSAANIGHHCKIVRECKQLRELYRLGVTIADRAYNRDTLTELLSDAERVLYDVHFGQSSGDWHTLRDITVQGVETIQRASERADHISGIPSGFRDVDKLLGGWQRSDLVLVAGRPSMGKTSFGLGCLIGAAKAGYHVAFMSLEMSRAQLAVRLLGMEAPLNVHELRCGRVPAEGWWRISSAAQAVSSWTGWIDDTAMLTVEQLRAKVRRLKSQATLDLLIVDYLQLMQLPKAESRQQGMADVSRAFKLLAKELDIPILALSQLSRECERREDKHPVLADLRDSGALEQDADLVLFLYREEVYDRDTEQKGIAKVLVRKHRNGPIGDQLLVFNERFARFDDLYES
ncbi:replicative DNA helicase [Nitrospiraceae bacterium AH_259_D15_M11_P09]|nr:replicative DNA helicase [Nitrospiraceae bacterium AH_259_D15_M11_P09]